MGDCVRGIKSCFVDEKHKYPVGLEGSKEGLENYRRMKEITHLCEYVCRKASLKVLKNGLN